MVRNAEDMMLDSEVAPFTNLLLGQISKLDQAGAWTWDLRFVSFLWFMGFWAVRLTFGKRGGVDWYALTHAIVTGVGGSVCAYLSFVSAEQMTGIPEPLGTVLCGGPLTSLHRILPTAALGYSIFDLIDGFTLGSDFLLHGLVMFAFALYMCETDKNEVFAVMLTLEVSTIFLNFVRAKFMSPTLSMVNMFAFAVSFFLSRILFGPYSWYRHVYYFYTVGQDSTCFSSSFKHVIFVTGLFFHILNAYWFYKIILKVRRKFITQEEALDAKNELNSHHGTNAKKSN